MDHTPAQNSTTRQVFNISQAADYLGVDRATVARRVADGTIPAARLSDRSVRIRRRDLDALFISRAQREGQAS